MHNKFKIIEVTKDKKHKYLDKIVELENSVYDDMVKKGRVGQLFTTGREDISSYVDSENNSVIIATIEGLGAQQQDVVAVAYITQGQIPFTYNDVTKYFKYGEEYNNAVRNLYKSHEDYMCALRDIYIKKICAFCFARDCILKDYVENLDTLSEAEKNNEFMRLVNIECEDSENNFHEKSKIRELLNQNMSIYMSQIVGKKKEYERFYWVDMDFIRKEAGYSNLSDVPIFITDYDSTIETYDKILKMQKYKIYECSEGMKQENYFGANTGNTIELDTYITSNNVRQNGLARIVTFEGIKKAIQSQINGNTVKGANSPIYLVSTLHRDNLSSKYVSEFFGLNDNLFVNRRTGRDREVHICRIDYEDINNYINSMARKLAVLYNYNPNGIEIKPAERRQILLEQLKYEQAELARLQNLNLPKYLGYIKLKKLKIEKLCNEINKLEVPDIYVR